MSPTPLQPIYHPLLDQHHVKLWLKREDLSHPLISGNKWHKLKLNLQAAKDQGHHTVISFGGPYSNHIHALAAAAPLYGLRSIGMIRGELHNNPTLTDAAHHGMQLHAISRRDYRHKHQPDFLRHLSKTFGAHYLIPEGGSNALAVEGCKDIIDQLKTQINLNQTLISCACGTGATFAGLILGAPQHCQLIGFPVLKQGEFLYDKIKQFLAITAAHPLPDHWHLETGYHCGGYGKVPEKLIKFILEFESYNHTILLDPIYTAKLLYGLFDLIQHGRFNNKTIIAIHTGGLQGRHSVPELQINNPSL